MLENMIFLLFVFGYLLFGMLAVAVLDFICFFAFGWSPCFWIEQKLFENQN